MIPYIGFLDRAEEKIKRGEALGVKNEPYVGMGFPEGDLTPKQIRTYRFFIKVMNEVE